MKKVMVMLLSLSLMAPAMVMAGPGPGGWHGGHGGGPGGGPGGWGGGGWGGGRPSLGMRYGFLPQAAQTVLIAGLTYYVLNGIYYQRQENQYVVVQAPPAPQNNYVVSNNSGAMSVLDLNGERFYVNQGHYYRRSINGDYLEVPRPPGL